MLRVVNRPARKPIANGNLCLSGGWRQRRSNYVTYLIYHSGPFSSIGNALQQGEIDPCLSLCQTVEADRSGIFPTGFSQFLFFSRPSVAGQLCRRCRGRPPFRCAVSRSRISCGRFSFLSGHGTADLPVCGCRVSAGRRRIACILPWLDSRFGEFRWAVCRLVPGGGSGQGWGSPLGDGSGGG